MLIAMTKSPGWSDVETRLTWAACAGRPSGSTTVTLAGKDAELMLKLSDALEDLDDVQNVYSNLKVSDEALATLEAA